MNIDVALLTFVSGSLIPFITGILTKSTARSAVKAVVSAILAIAVAVVSYLTDFQGVSDWKTALFVGLGALLAQGAIYQGFLKPTGVGPAVSKNTDTVAFIGPNRRAPDA